MVEWINIEVGRRKRPPRIVLSLSRTIRFNKTMIDDNKLGDIRFVRLVARVEPDATVIGFILSHTGGDNFLKFSVSKNGAYISGSSLFAALKIDVNKLKNRKFTPYKEKYNDDEIIAIRIPKDK